MNTTTLKDISEIQQNQGSDNLRRVIDQNQRPFVGRNDAAKASVDLPPIKSARQLIEQNLALPDEIVHGLLHKGSKMVLGGGSKTFKTFCLADLALSISNGVQWWGMNTTKGRVLYINFEIQEGFFAKRLNDISAAKGMGMDALDNLDVWNLRGHCADLSTLMKSLLEKIQKDHYSLIVIDPIYKGLGTRDENSAGDINSLLNEVEKMAVQTGAAVIFGAHFSKGNQAGKESIDRISGSGVFARDPDTILVMTKHENDNTYTVEPTLRNFKPIDAFCVRWVHPLMQRDEKADPAKLKRPGTKTAKYTSQQLLECLGDEQKTTTEWYLCTAHKTDMCKRTFMEKLGEIKNDATKVIKSTEGYWKAVHPLVSNKMTTNEAKENNNGAEVQQVHFAPNCTIAPGAVKSVQQAAL